MACGTWPCLGMTLCLYPAAGIPVFYAASNEPADVLPAVLSTVISAPGPTAWSELGVLLGTDLKRLRHQARQARHGSWRQVGVLLPVYRRDASPDPAGRGQGPRRLCRPRRHGRPLRVPGSAERRWRWEHRRTNASSGKAGGVSFSARSGRIEDRHRRGSGKGDPVPFGARGIPARPRMGARPGRGQHLQGGDFQPFLAPSGRGRRPRASRACDVRGRLLERPDTHGDRRENRGKAATAARRRERGAGRHHPGRTSGASHES